ncbi:DUF4145 domain-containing protein [Pontibacter pamirensis]|uniref:DUF4145 domain-containing protein n=1 Tax=Pontibacter pamirensis TaxID=2562824 RepID=UPI00138A18B1|nr:DUF4145 domain-containing protein [Pontibacter pamirensis]
MIRQIPQQYIVANIQKALTRVTFKLPTSVDTTCPHCRRKVNYHIEWNTQLNTAVNHANSHCPACQGQVRFVQIIDKAADTTILSGELYIHPGAELRHPLEDADTYMTDGLARAYFSTINVLNAQEWTATSVLCRRVLEGITKSKLPNDKNNKPLANQLKALPDHMDFSKPILTLADAIRKGGNLGAHFDLEKEPNEEISQLMVDLLDYLIEYLFILPSRIESLHDKIEELSKSTPPNEGS